MTRPISANLARQIQTQTRSIVRLTHVQGKIRVQLSAHPATEFLIISVATPALIALPKAPCIVVRTDSMLVRPPQTLIAPNARAATTMRIPLVASTASLAKLQIALNVPLLANVPAVIKDK